MINITYIHYDFIFPKSYPQCRLLCILQAAELFRKDLINVSC